MSIINGWITCQVDLFLDFPQAEIEFYMYMEIPQRIETKGGIRIKHVLKLLKNLYVQTQGYWLCNQHFTKELE